MSGLKRGPKTRPGGPMTERVAFRCTLEERRRIEAEAMRADLVVSDYLRARMLLRDGLDAEVEEKPSCGGATGKAP